jgi:hypothetical protein
MKNRPLGLVVLSAWLIVSAALCVPLFFFLANKMEAGQTFPMTSPAYATLPLFMFSFLILHLVSGIYLLQAQAWARPVYLWIVPILLVGWVIEASRSTAPGVMAAMAVFAVTYVVGLVVLLQGSVRAYLANSR